METVSFIIRTRNEEASIVTTLISLRKQKLNEMALEIILVDSESDDNTVELARPYVDKIVTIRRKDFTWGRAINLGIEASKGRYIGLTSGHCTMDQESSLMNAVDLLTTKGIVCVYGRQKGDPQKDPFECVDLERVYPAVEYLETPDSRIPYSNACCLLKREYWEDNHFDETLQSAEDVKWAEDMQKLGYRLGYSSCFSVIHGHHLDVDYLYRKTYWKVYRDQFRLDRPKRGFKANGVYLAIVNKFIHPILETKRYNKCLDVLGIPQPWMRTLGYMIVRYSAHYDSKKAYYSGKIQSKKYEELQTPMEILKFARRLHIE